MIQFEQLTKRFGDKIVLNGISLTISEGQIVFIIGTSGTGKSVLLKTLVGLLKADGGKIFIDQQNVTDFSEIEFMGVRKKCGMVFQNPALFDSMTIFENVAFGLRRHFQLDESTIIERVEKALSLVHLKGVSQKKPNQLSYGMQKRVSIARTVALEPQILLFDEPTTGLDPINTNAVNQLIQELSRKLKTTSVVVSHDMHCALAIADQIVVLDRGSIVYSGTPQQLKQSAVPLVKDFLAEVTT